ncbi:MAG: hypothetical protein K8I27_14815 [Planctomycetes bacterium]|nr:hypothetical protein [Planctomycetota bacterium]
MARRNRRRKQQNWAVQGDPETVRQFSFHRMIEHVSDNQLEALQSLIGMHELELQMKAFMAALGVSAEMQQRQLQAFEASLKQLPNLDTNQRTYLLDTLKAMMHGQPALPPVKPPRG